MISIRDPEFRDIAVMGETMRIADRLEIMSEGRHSGSVGAITWALSVSRLKRAADWDGQLMALWGVVCGGCGAMAYPWLYTTTEVDLHPLSFVRAARREAVMLRLAYPRMKVNIATEYVGAVKLVSHLGFTEGVPTRIRPGGPRFTMMEVAHG